jgi:uncharacterized protein YfaS (alpha-2-macroglobulin family)
VSGVYDVGDLVKVFVTFTDADGDATDPTDVTLVIRRPDGSVETVTTGFDHEADSGYYSYDVAMDMAGRWDAEWRGTGAVTAVEPTHWTTRFSKVDGDESE